MKKIIALTTALVLIIMFAGCNANNSASQTDAETKAAKRLSPTFRQQERQRKSRS